jgi:quercetin dioxygenase-like cupin family protein
MAIKPHVVVSGTGQHGKSVVLVDEPARATTAAAFPGLEFFMVWGTQDGLTTLGDTSIEPQLWPFFPGPGGTRLLFARYAPQSATPEPTGDQAQLVAEAAEKLPGLSEVIEPEQNGMHTTNTIDYGVCLEGELVLALEDDEMLITPGTVVVQLGARHAWHNRSDNYALMCFFGLGIERTR